MSVKSQQIIRHSTSQHRTAFSGGVRRMSGLAGNHTLRRKMNSGEQIKSRAEESERNSSVGQGLAPVLQRKCACAGSDEHCAACEGEKGIAMSRRMHMKLTVNKAGDRFEQEADRIADRVMANSTDHSIAAAPTRLQRFAAQSIDDGGKAPASVHRVLSGSGRPLQTSLRKDMEQRFNHNFSTVRVHTGPTAELSAREVNAQAYTVGRDIVFGTGRFAPETQQGSRLIAHELAHVVQSGESAGLGSPPMVRRQPQTPTTTKNPDPNAPENRVGPLDVAQEIGETGILFIPGEAAAPGEGLSVGGVHLPYKSFRVMNPLKPQTIPKLPTSSDDLADLVLSQFQQGSPLPRPGYTLLRPGYPMLTLPRFVMDVSKDGVNLMLPGLVDLEMFTNRVSFARRPVQGTPPGRPPDENNSKTIGLVDTFLSVGRKLHLHTTLRIDDDYPESYVDPTLIDLSLTTERFSDLRVVRHGKEFVVDPLLHARATVFNTLGYSVNAKAHVGVNRLVGSLVGAGIGNDQAVQIVDALPAMFNEILASAHNLDAQQVAAALSQIKSPDDLRKKVRQLIAQHLPADTEPKIVDRAADELVAEITHPGFTLTGSLILRLPGSDFQRTLKGLGWLEPRLYFSAETTRSVRSALAGDPFGLNFPYTFVSLGPTVIAAGRISEVASPAVGFSAARYGKTAGASFSIAGRPYLPDSGLPGLVGLAELKAVKRIAGVDIGLEASYKLESGSSGEKKTDEGEDPFVADYKTFQGSRRSGTRQRDIPELQERVEGVLSYPRTTKEGVVVLTVTKTW